jgi:4-diphosphocytidyl-2-C-methyl-D-erythritol kinase
MDDRKQFKTIKGGLSVLAPAKINLSLLIAGKRPDGFHEIETVMAKINWYDEILICNGEKTGIDLICKGPCWAPDGQENLVYKAAALMMQKCRLSANLQITLIKNIPAGTGLGSASSDTAATLLGLNQLLKTGLNDSELSEMAQALGSDVPFFLNGPLALCRGKGEKITKINEKFNFRVILILSDISVSTKKVYANYVHNERLYEQASKTLIGFIEKNRIDLVAKHCINMLQESCFDLEKSLAKLKNKVQSLGIGPCCLTGSGSALFCIIESEDDGQNAIEYQHKIEKETGCKSIIARNNRW